MTSQPTKEYQMKPVWEPECGHKVYHDTCGPCESYDPPKTKEEWDKWHFENDEGLRGKHYNETDY